MEHLSVARAIGLFQQSRIQGDPHSFIPSAEETLDKWAIEIAKVTGRTKEEAKILISEAQNVNPVITIPKLVKFGIPIFMGVALLTFIGFGAYEIWKAVTKHKIVNDNPASLSSLRFI